MNISNIQTGDIIKDYPTLCNLLEIKPTKGDGRKYQLRDFERYCSYHMNKRAFIIDEVYKNEMIKPKKDDRALGNNNVYMKNEELALINYLSKTRYQDGYNKIEITTLRLAVLTGLCRDEYLEYVNTKKGIQNLSVITKEDRELFYQRAGLKLNRSVRQMLESLVKRFVILLEEGHKIGEYGTNKRLYWRTADSEENEKIKKAKHKVIQSMGLWNNGDTLGAVIKQNRLKEFYKRLNKYVQDEYGWWRIYSIHIISFSDDIDNDIEIYKRSPEELKSGMLEVNSSMSNFLDKQAERTFNEYQKFVASYLGEVSNIGIKKKVKPVKDDFLNNQKLLTDNLIRMDENKS